MTEEERSALTLRPLTAGALLTLRHSPALADCPPEERGLRGNALVLAACCFRDGEAVFSDGEAVLAQLTVGEMEALLRQLLAGDGAQPVPGGENPRFDRSRFLRLKGEA
ncbi:MAG: hypothetical protein RR426_00065 [Oscillospiraceae bacterium]